MIVVTATVGQIKLVPRFGPRPLMTTGMLLAAVAMSLLAQLDTQSNYVAGVLPALLVQALGLGLVFSPAFASATSGVRPGDAGVASAMVNTSQQVGGSIGTAFLSTMANSATAGFLADAGGNPSALAGASVHGFTTAFWWSAGIFAAGALVTRLVVRPGVPRAVVGESALAHT